MKYLYQNQIIRQRAEQAKSIMPANLWVLLGALLCIFQGFFLTGRDLYKNRPIRFDRLEGYSEIVRTVTVTEMPVRIDDTYYMVKVDDKAILMSPVDDALRSLEATGSAVVRGRLHVVGDDAVSKAAEEYYKANYSFTEAERARYAHFFLDCSPVSYWKVLAEDHWAWLWLGSILLIFLGFWEHAVRSRFFGRYARPAGGKLRLSPEQIDLLANHPESVWLPGTQIYLTPLALIGFRNGLTAVDYREIRKLRIRRKLSLPGMKPRYSVTVKAGALRKLVLSASADTRELQALRDAVAQHAPGAAVLDETDPHPQKKQRTGGRR